MKPINCATKTPEKGDKIFDLSIKPTHHQPTPSSLTFINSSRSMLLGRRPLDSNSLAGFTKWPFMTTHAWGESPRGVWRLIVTMVKDQNYHPDDNDMYGGYQEEEKEDERDNEEEEEDNDEGHLFEWTLMLHGSKKSSYTHQKANLKRHTKLAVVKRQHETDSRFYEM